MKKNQGSKYPIAWQPEASKMSFGPVDLGNVFF